MMLHISPGFPREHHPGHQALRRPLLMWLLALAWLFVHQGALAEETPANVNLLANPSFEETAGAGTDERLVPGWNVRFRAKETEPALAADGVSIVDDPAQAHSGKRCLRIQPQKRSIELSSPVENGALLSPRIFSG